MNLKYVSIESILTKIYRDYGKQLDEGDIIEWVGEALDALIAGTVAFDKKVAIMTVKDHQCLLPNNCESILQIARNNDFDVSSISTLPNQDDIKFYDTDGNLIDQTTDLTIIPYMEVYFSSTFWNSTKLQERFSPVRLSGNTFFDEITPLEVRENPYKRNNFEYTIIDESILRFNFIEGQIYIAFYQRKLSENGFPMIPDHYVFQKAIESYVMWRISNKEFYNHVQGSDARLIKSESDWIKFKEQARALSIIPQTIDEMERLVRNNNNIVQGSSRYENYFDNNYYNYGNKTTYVR
jgi:hypothetical protein